MIQIIGKTLDAGGAQAPRQTAVHQFLLVFAQRDARALVDQLADALEILVGELKFAGECITHAGILTGRLAPQIAISRAGHGDAFQRGWYFHAVSLHLGTTRLHAAHCLACTETLSQHPCRAGEMSAIRPGNRYSYLEYFDCLTHLARLAFKFVGKTQQVLCGAGILFRHLRNAFGTIRQFGCRSILFL